MKTMKTTEKLVKNGMFQFLAMIPVVIGLMLTDAAAESMAKHPRVAELEDSLRSQASDYLRSRFPEQPFLVNVSVDPIRRMTGNNRVDANGDVLPYFDASDNEITDEWDDPATSLHQLLLRTNKVLMEISLSENVSDGERAEVRDALYRSLHLIPARDEVKIETRKWSSVRSYTYYFLTGVAIILFFLLGFALVQRYGYKKIAQAMSQVQIQGGGGGGGVATPMPASASQEQRGGGSGGEFSDPVKARELMVKLVDASEKTTVFPTLNTMVALDRIGHKNPAALGAILQELPAAMQKKLFAFGTDHFWFEAMLQPGHFGMDEVEQFQRLVREATFAHEVHVEEMLIRVWRVGAGLENFMRGLDRDLGLSILSLFPKDMAIQHARKAFPGAWADLLDPDFKPVKFTQAQCKDVGEKAEKLKALMDFSKLAHYRQLSELMCFLSTANPEEEKEIYLISKPSSMIHQTRAPFYPVLEASEEDLSGFVTAFTPQQWTLALFNVARGSRKKIQDQMQEKQRFMFIERLKQLDQSHPDAHQVGQMREMIAKKFREHLANKEKLDDALKAVAGGEAGAKNDDDQAA